MNKIANRQVICDVLMERAAHDRDMVVLCSDSRGSASLAPFAKEYPEQFVEVGIAEQSLVSIAAGLARCGKKAFAASPASFLSTRSMEQVKVDVAYSGVNVKLIGISGGISYGALGMTHHSLQDIAALGAIPGMRVYLPSDRYQTKALLSCLACDDKPAYIRVGRNPVEDVYEEGLPFRLDQASFLRRGKHAAIIACGELVGEAVKAADLLLKKGILATVVDMYCIKPLDQAAVLEAAREAPVIFTVEEHSVFGGLGAQVSQLLAARAPRRVITLGLPDEPVVAGGSREVFAYYGLSAEGVAQRVCETLREEALL